ncbi:hypothetical protein QOT17_005478 [Balamuthia mandrillaris]
MRNRARKPDSPTTINTNQKNMHSQKKSRRKAGAGGSSNALWYKQTSQQQQKQGLWLALRRSQNNGCVCVLFSFEMREQRTENETLNPPGQLRQRSQGSGVFERKNGENEPEMRME